MARSLVMRPGHVALRVLDMEEALEHYTQIIGLIEVARGDDGRVYLKAWDEMDHHSVVLREADRPGMDYFGLKVVDEQSLDLLADKLENAGFKTIEIPAGDQLATGRRIRITTPSGHELEFFATKDMVGNGLPEVNPAPWPKGLVGAQPTRFDHILVFGPNFDETVSLFTDVLDFDMTEQVMDGELRIAAFLSCSNKAHDFAIIRHEQPGALHHISFNLESWSDLLRAGDLLGMHKVQIDNGPTRHGLTRGQTIYFYDPSGNRNEVFAGGYIWYPDKPRITWTADEIEQAIFYHDRDIKPAYIEGYT